MGIRARGGDTRLQLVLLSFFEVQFILTTDPPVADMLGQLQYIYSTFFVSHVLKNPLYSPGEPFVYVTLKRFA